MESNIKPTMAIQITKNIVTQGKSTGWAEKLKLLNSIINAIVFYASERWGIEESNTIEKAQLTFLKSILQCPNKMRWDRNITCGGLRMGMSTKLHKKIYTADYYI